MSNAYVNADYIDNTPASGDYFVGDLNQLRGGSIRWQDCTSWQAWPNSRWSPGIESALTLSASATGTKAKSSGPVTSALVLSASTTGTKKLGGIANPALTIGASSTAGVKFGGTATPSLTLSANVLSAVMQLPFPHTTFVVESETRAYPVPFEPDFRTHAIENGETRVYPVIHETRTRVIESETREQPTEVY